MASLRQAIGWPRSGSGDAPLPVLSARGSTLVGRAQLANLLAERALRPSEPLPFTGGDAVACELSREATFWALLALRELGDTTSPSAADADSLPPAPGALAPLWSEIKSDLLNRAAGGPEQAERLRAELLDKSFADFAELSPDLQAGLAKRLHAFAERLIEPLAVPQRAQERVWVARFQLLLAALVVVVGLGLIGKALIDRHALSLDLAPSASWKASSQIDDCSCKSPEQSCACPNFFFHTQEENHPSIVFDLHRVQSLSAVVVDNRQDCCSERALPLIVQVSTDQKHWKTVATRKDEFVSWRADFPTEQTRWVKLYVGRRDYLHLARVRLVP